MTIGNIKPSKESIKDFELLLQEVKDLYTPDELQQIRLAYDSMKSSGKAKAKLIRPVVPIKEWLNSSYYIGPDVDLIYPFWKQQVIDIIDSPVKINQLILTGALGTGKSTMAVLILIRKIYELSCYEHISALFKLFGVSRIAFAYLSVTREQAQNTGFALLLEWLDSIPYFKEQFKRNQSLDSMLIWPQERLIVTFGSVANHFIGLNLIGSILDEANFFSGRSKEDSDYAMNNKVAELYTQIITRSQSRFIINGVNESLSILVSSSTVNSSFTNERIAMAKDDPHTVVISPALWDVKPWNYSGKKFLVFAGDSTYDPFIVSSIDELNTMLEAAKHSQLPVTISLQDAYSLLPSAIQGKIIMVPEEHRQAFQGNIIIALQDLAGYSVSAANRLFSSYAAYERCIEPSLLHPFSKEAIILSTTKEFTQDGFLPIKSYMLSNTAFKDLNMLRYMHIDLALTGDSLGIALCHISGWKNIYKQKVEYEQLDDKNNYKPEDEIKIPIIAYDFMLRINPPKKPNKISLSKVRDFIIFLANEYHIKFGLITADQFQSVQLLQELQELGFPTAGLSVDRTPDAYLAFTDLVYEERVIMYNYAPFKQELFSVVYYPALKKVDHIAGGSKDVADAVVGAAFNAVRAQDKTDVREQALTDLFIFANNYADSPEEAAKKVIDSLTRMLTQR